MKWTDTLDIAIALAEHHPDVDPRYVRFTDLHRWVMELEEFSDDANRSGEKILEAIQMAWIEEWIEGSFLRPGLRAASLAGQAEPLGFKGVLLGSPLARVASDPRHDCRAVNTPIGDTFAACARARRKPSPARPSPRCSTSTMSVA